MPQTFIGVWGLFFSIIFLFLDVQVGIYSQSFYIINRIKICTVIYNNNNNTVDSVENVKKKE